MYISSHKEIFEYKLSPIMKSFLMEELFSPNQAEVNLFILSPEGKREILQMFLVSPIDISMLFLSSLYILEAYGWQEPHPLPLGIFSVY